MNVQATQTRSRWVASRPRSGFKLPAANSRSWVLGKVRKQAEISMISFDVKFEKYVKFRVEEEQKESQTEPNGAKRALLDTPGALWEPPGSTFGHPGGTFGHPGGTFGRPGGIFERPGGTFGHPGGK